MSWQVRFMFYFLLALIVLMGVLLVWTWKTIALMQDILTVNFKDITVLKDHMEAAGKAILYIKNFFNEGNWS